MQLGVSRDRLGETGAGAFKVEVDLMQPIDPDKRPKVHDPALNHIGLWIDDLPKAVEWLEGQGVRFTRAYANAPVCAVARSALLTGLHSSTLGTHQMRSRPQLPNVIPNYPTLLRQAAVSLGMLGDKSAVPQLLEMMSAARGLSTQAANCGT